MWLLLLFVFLLIIEIVLFIQVGGVIGVLLMIFLVLLLVVLGVVVMCWQGVLVMLDMQWVMQEFCDFMCFMVYGVLIMFVGGLMVVLGLFISVFGLLLLILLLCDLVLCQMGKWVCVVGVVYCGCEGDFMFDVLFGYGCCCGDGVIDGEYFVQDDMFVLICEGLIDQVQKLGNFGWIWY